MDAEGMQLMYGFTLCKCYCIFNIMSARFLFIKEKVSKRGFFKAYESADIFQKTYSLESHVSLIIRDNYWINLSAVYQKVKQNRFST